MPFAPGPSGPDGVGPPPDGARAPDAPEARPTALEAAAAARRLRVAPGEEVRVRGPGRAEIHSRGALPLRVRVERLHHARTGLPGTAVLIGDEIYEVLSQATDGDSFVYGLREWPPGEVVRSRAVYDEGFVRGVMQMRQEDLRREAVRPWRAPLYPFVGLLPEEEQERVCERLGLDSLTATFVSGCSETFAVMLGLLLVLRALDPGSAIVGLGLLPGLVLFALPGLGRAFGAMFLGETAGSPLLGPVVALLSRPTLPQRTSRLSGCEVLTRSVFWRRLARPDEVQPLADGSFLVRGPLPHLSWDPRRRLEIDDQHWNVEPQPLERSGDHLVYVYRLHCEVAEGFDPPGPPDASAYANEVMGEVRYEWDGWNAGFSWLTMLLSTEVQARAFGHRGGPAAVRRPTIASAMATGVIGMYLLVLLRGGPAADPLAPFVAGTSLLALLDAVLRIRAARAGRYAPSLLRWLLPGQLLRPERAAFRAHQQAEREAVAALAEQQQAGPGI